MSKRRDGRVRQLLNSEDRARYGSLTTWENAAGETFVIHRTGKLKEAIREAAAIALALDPSFRLVSYSTPDTIYTDLKGGRADFIHPASGFKATYGKANPVALPEQIILGQAGLRHLIHPKIVRLTTGQRP